MADEQIILEIKVEDSEIVKAEKNVDGLTDSIEELGNLIKDARKQNKEFKKDQEALNKAYRNGKITTNQYEKGIDGLNVKIKSNNKLIATTSIELSKQKIERNANIKLLNTEADTLRRLEARATLLNQAISKQSQATKEGREEYARLEKELGAVNAQVNEQRQLFKDNTKNIGNYTKSIEKAISKNRLLNAFAKLAGKGISVFGRGLKALMKIGILGMLSLLSESLALIGKAFKQSANGSRVMNKSMAVLEGLFSVLVTVVDKFAGFMLKAFEDPKEAIKELGELIKENLFNRIEGVIDLFKALGLAIKGDFAEATELASMAVLKFTTGLDSEDVIEFKDELLEASKEAENLAAKFLALEKAQFRAKSSIRALDKDIAILNAELEVLNETLGDDTRNMNDMREASEQALIKSIELAKQQ